MSLTTAKVAVYKAVQRLLDRGLVKAMCGFWSKRYAGVMLTEQGKAAAETITANLGESLGQVSHQELRSREGRGDA